MIDKNICIFSRVRRHLVTATLIPALLFTSNAFAQETEEIPNSDPSHLRPYVEGDLPEGLPEANAGSLEGGDTGTLVDASAENVLQPEDQRDDGVFNVPSNGPPSPLFGAQPFTQQLLRFEEFGPVPRTGGVALPEQVFQYHG